MLALKSNVVYFLLERQLMFILLPAEVIRDKDEEKKKLDEEEQEWLTRRRSRSRKIIQIEKEELESRESEVRQSSLLDKDNESGCNW